MKIVELTPNEGSKAKLIGYLHEINGWEMPNRLSWHCVVICSGGGNILYSAQEVDHQHSRFSQGDTMFLFCIIPLMKT